MAAGEYVSVTRRPTARRPSWIASAPSCWPTTRASAAELTAIYVGRGLDPALAKQVAEQLMAHDALGAHARDELGISESLRARPIQAALASAGSFAVGAAMPLLVAAARPGVGAHSLVVGHVAGVSRAARRAGGRAGGAGVRMGALRVTFWGASRWLVTAGVGSLFGTTV